MVAVRMVSEGVDVPRLAVGVYATSVSTPLFFAQAVGRFVRARRRGETASVFLPRCQSCSASPPSSRPSAIMWSRAVAGSGGGACRGPARARDTPTCQIEGRSFEALQASATFDRVLFDGGEFGTATEAGSPEEEDYLGLPGLLEPDQVATLLRKRQAAQLAARSAGVPAATQPHHISLLGTVSHLCHFPPKAAAASSATPAEAPVSTVSRERLAALRKELNGLVGAWSHRTGQPHGVIHTELRRACGGPAIPQASAEQIQARIEMIRQWALSRR